MLKLKSVQFVYTDRDELFAVHTARSVRNDKVFLEISTDSNIFTVNVHASSEITIKELSACFEYPFNRSDRIFLNGYQSWTDSYEHGINGRMHGIDRVPSKLADKYAFSQYGDYNIVSYPSTPGELHGWTYGYIRHGDEFDFIGSLNEDTGFTMIKTKTNEDCIFTAKDCTDLVVNGEYCGLKLNIKSGTENEVFDQYFKLLNIAPNKDVKPIFGYTSWYRHYQDINRDLILNDLEGLKNQKYKSDVFQIDDGWQTAVGDWLSVDGTKFPEGMKPLADAVSEADMTPGLWLAPFVCEENSALFRDHHDWLARNLEGEYIKGGSNWSGFYALDIYNPCVREYLRNVFDTVINQWGFKLLKLDFLYAACIEPHADKTRGTIMADAMDFLREATKGAYILGCGVPLGSAFGKVDYCRIGCDVSLDWNDKPHMRLTHRERVSTRNTVLDTTFRRQLNGRAFINDPDVFLLRDDDTALTVSQKRCLAEINALMGGVLFTSDDVAEYGTFQQKTLDVMVALKDAEVISADLNAGILTVKFILNNKSYTRIYRM